MDDALESAPGDGVGLGSSRHSLLISDRRGIMHEHMLSAAAEGEYPMRHPPRNHVITRNKDDGHVARVKRPHQDRFVHRRKMGADIERASLAPKLGLRELDDAPPVRRFHHLDKIWPAPTHLDFRRQSMATQRDRHSGGPAAAGTSA